MDIEYYIKPRLYLINQRFWCFSDEIHQMDLSQIEDGIDSCKFVLEGNHQEINWGLEISQLIIQKEKSTLKYNGLFEAEIPTIQIYNMLREYRDKLVIYENERLK